MEIKQLLKKEPRELAGYIKQQCCHSGGVVQLNELLDYLLDPAKGLDEHDCLEWCKALIAGGVPFEEFAKTGTIHTGMSRATAGPGETFLRGPSEEKIFEFLFLKSHIMVNIIFLNAGGTPKHCRAWGNLPLPLCLSFSMDLNT